MMRKILIQIMKIQKEKQMKLKKWQTIDFYSQEYFDQRMKMEREVHSQKATDYQNKNKY